MEDIEDFTEPPNAPIIELADVRLRPLCIADRAALYEYLSIPIVTERTGYPVVNSTLVELIINRSRSRWANGDIAKWAITTKTDDRLIGTCGFHEWLREHQSTELAYDLAPAYWGKGLMYQAVTAVLQWTHENTPIDRIQALVRTDNDRSARLLIRLGFKLEGLLRRYRICRGTPHDFYTFSLLRSDPLPSPTPTSVTPSP